MSESESQESTEYVGKDSGTKLLSGCDEQSLRLRVRGKWQVGLLTILFCGWKANRTLRKKPSLSSLELCGGRGPEFKSRSYILEAILKKKKKLLHAYLIYQSLNVINIFTLLQNSMRTLKHFNPYYPSPNSYPNVIKYFKSILFFHFMRDYCLLIHHKTEQGHIATVSFKRDWEIYFLDEWICAQLKSENSIV